MRPLLHALTGPTAVGKTEWALRWAERYGAEIVSCDALLFYQGMDVGTAKPGAADLGRVPHHLIDILPVGGRMDVARYVVLARDVLDGLRRRGCPVLVTGGSGFYLQAFLRPVADDLDVTPELRAEVEGLPLELALEQLHILNPNGLGPLDVANPRRVRRALERCRASGRTLADLRADWEARPGAFADWDVRLTRLEREPDDLNARIEARVEGMLSAGLVDEVSRLRTAGLELNPSAARAIGYREVLDYLDGRLRREDLATEIARNTRALVKKQRTWFRTQLPVHRVLPAAGIRDADELFAP